MPKTIPYADDMDLGRGYNVLAGDALPSTAVLGSLTSVIEAGGQRVESEIRRVDSSEQLNRAMGVSVEAGGSYSGFSANAKVEYSESSSINSYSTYLLVKVLVKSKTITLKDPVLTDDAAELIRNNNPTRFRERFGDVFQSGLIRGGELYAVLEISGYDATERESTAVDIEASFNGVIASATLQTKISASKAASRSQLNVTTRVFRNGSTSQIPYTVEEILAAAKSFNTEVDGDKAYAYAMLIEDYRALKLPNDSFNPIEIERQQTVLNDFAKRRYDFLKLRNDLEFILRNPAAFEIADDDTARLTAWFVEVSGIVDALERGALACSKDAAQCVLPTVTVASYPLPKMRPAAPRAVEVARTIVPDFTTCSSTEEVNKKATDARLVVNTVEVGVSPTFKIDKSEPPAGTDVPEGSIVLLTKRRYAPAEKVNPQRPILNVDRDLLTATKVNVTAIKNTPSVHRLKKD